MIWKWNYLITSAFPAVAQPGSYAVYLGAMRVCTV
jgi:hypothetical protein